MIAYNKKVIDSVFKDYKKKSPFYKKKLQNFKHFDDTPFTSKSELISSQEQYPVYGDFTLRDVKISQVYRTSGTLSNPLILTFSEKDIKILTEIGKESFLYAGMGKDNSEIVINCLNYTMWTGGAFDAMAISKTGVQLINFSTGNSNALLKLILLLKKDKKNKISLHCTPSYLTILENVLYEEFRLKPSDLAIYSFYLGGEAGIQNNAYREKLADVWNAKILNANYGMSEVSSIMASANIYNFLKFSNLFLDNFLLELKCDNEKLLFFDNLKTGDTGELIVTSLCKESQALFRYNTKEIIKITNINKNDIFFEIVSRSDDMFVYRGINLFPEQFRSVLCKIKGLSGLFKIQIKKEQNNIVSYINLICEKKSNYIIDNNVLGKDIAKSVKRDLSIKPNIEIVEKIRFEGNKFKIVEFIY